MKSVWLYLIFTLVIPALLTGQVTLVEHTVDDNIYGTASLYACDLDNDGDMDILGASYEEHTIDWWRNDGGTPFQWTRRIITTNFTQAGSVYASDLNGDSLIDVLGCARIGDQLAWFYNDGTGNVPWTKYIIKSGYDLAHEVYTCDLDKDGDQDVFGAASNDNELTWWRNDGGFPVNWTEQVIDSDFNNAKSIHVADFDGDSILDVVGAALYGNSIAWYQNDGGNLPQWTEYLITSSFYGAHRVEGIDLDKDGRMDILGAGYFHNAIAWWRNNGGTPITWTQQMIGTIFQGACIAQGVDLDGDYDIDVVGTAQAGNQVAWWRNEGGSPPIWTKFLIDSLPRAWPLYCCDLDQDGDIDIIAGSSWNGSREVKWYENQGTAVAENKQDTPCPCLSISPNPTTYRVMITYNITSASDVSLKICDVSGKVVQLLFTGNQTPGTHTVYWDNDHTPCGVYFCQLVTNDQISTAKLTLLR